MRSLRNAVTGSLLVALYLGIAISSPSPADQDHEIVFSADPQWEPGAPSGGRFELFLIATDGSNKVQLTFNDRDDRIPDWSPDGQQLVYQSDVEEPANVDIYIINEDGSNRRRLTSHPAVDEKPAWSPDGEWIAFNSDRDGNIAIYLIRVDGTELQKLIEGGGPVGWAPDGTRLAFDLDGDIFVINRDGTARTQLTHTASFDAGPAWSPDGTRIAFHSNRTGDFEIFVMDVDGANPVNLTNSPGVGDFLPAWSPDGQFIAFQSDRVGGPGTAHDLFIMGADGSDQRNITQDAQSWDEGASWRRVPPSGQGTL